MDQALEEIGGFGTYHRWIYFLLCIPVLFVGAANFSYVFIAATPPYRCAVPVCDSSHHPTYNASFLSFTIPTNDDGSYKSCIRYLYKNDSIQEFVGNFTTPSPNSKQCSPEHFSKITVEDCPHGYIFDDSIYKSTIVTEFDLTCGDAWEAAMSQSIFFAGVLVGAFVWGIISDWFGRKYIILLNLVLMALSGVATALAPNMIFFNFMRFFFAVTSAGVFQTAFVLGLELVGAEYRELCAVLGQYVFALGEVLLGCLGLRFRTWRMLQLVISAPLTVGILYGFVVPESPRWLISRGRREEAIAIMERIARCNGKQLPRHLLAVEEDVSNEHQMPPQNEYDSAEDDVFTGSAEHLQSSQPSSVSIVNVLRTPVMCCRLVVMIFTWVIVTFVYYGLSLTAADLAPGSNSSSKPYVQFILTALVELPGYTAAWLLMRYWGRRPALALSLIVAGLGCASAGLLLKFPPGYYLGASLVGKGGITSAFGIIYLYTPEIFPTSSRITVLGACSTFARLGGMLAPFSNDLKAVYGALPMTIFAVLSLACSACVCPLPETRGASLPDSIDDALMLGRPGPASALRVSSPSSEPSNSESEALLDHEQVAE